jgi:hypothetical protein
MLMIAAVRYPLAQDAALALQLTNVASIGLGTMLRFFLYRRWVFLAPAVPPTSHAGEPRRPLATEVFGPPPRPTS